MSLVLNLVKRDLNRSDLAVFMRLITSDPDITLYKADVMQRSYPHNPRDSHFFRSMERFLFHLDNPPIPASSSAARADGQYDCRRARWGPALHELV